jgi:hypothetical protein
MSLVTIATFTNAFNMHVIKGRLENEGIPAFAKDEHTVTVNPLYGGALGGIKLQVREEDVADALRILADAGYVQPQLFEQPETGKRNNPLLTFLKFLLFFVLLLGLVYLLHNPLSYLDPAPRPVILPLPAVNK